MIFLFLVVNHFLDELLAIDHIAGIFDHSLECRQEVVMESNPRIPLHPDLRTYAMDLL